MARPRLELSGKRFGKLVVVERASGCNWLCKCDCGNQTIARSDLLQSGRKKSCGCNRSKHGMTGTRIYRIYKGMKERCLNKNIKLYEYYGGRGIGICPEWLGKDGFINFYNWSMENGYSDMLSIDRINPNSDYSPQNCRWVTDEIQQRNKRPYGTQRQKFLLKNVLYEEFINSGMDLDIFCKSIIKNDVLREIAEREKNQKNT